MWLVLQPILMIGMLLNDNVLTAVVVAVLATRLTNRLISEIDEFAMSFARVMAASKPFRHDANDCVRSPRSISRRENPA